MPESLKNQFISDLYTSLLHLSGAELGAHGPLNKVFDGAGNSTGLALSGKRVIINNYIYPIGYDRHSRPVGPTEWLDAFFPIGCLQLTFDDNDPNTRIAGTTWGLVSEGRFLVGVGTFSDKWGQEMKFCPGSPPSATDSGNLAGEYRHTLTIDEIPAHSHVTNAGSTTVQVPSPVGIGDIVAAEMPGIDNSTLGFATQQQARNTLANKIRWNLGNVNGVTGTAADNFEVPDSAVGAGDYLTPVKYGFDLNFLRGSAASNGDRDPGRGFINNSNWEFKEMIGIWNGETRFIASKPATDANIPPQSSQWNLRSIDWHDVCLGLGCVDITNARAGNAAFAAEQNSTTPLVTGDQTILNGEVGSSDPRMSNDVGNGLAHNNIPPSYGVYVWKRLT